VGQVDGQQLAVAVDQVAPRAVGRGQVAVAAHLGEHRRPGRAQGQHGEGQAEDGHDEEDADAGVVFRPSGGARALEGVLQPPDPFDQPAPAAGAPPGARLDRLIAEPPPGLARSLTRGLLRRGIVVRRRLGRFGRRRAVIDRRGRRGRRVGGRSVARHVDQGVLGGLALGADRRQAKLLGHHLLDAARLLQIGDLGLQQADADLLVVDLLLDRGDLGPLAAGEGLGHVDAQHQHQQDAQADQLDDPEAPHAAVEDAGQAHAALQTGAVVRTAARSFDERARGLTASSASPGAMALDEISWKLAGAPGDRRRVARPARRAARALGQEILDDAVFQRMEGHHRQATARLQHPLGGHETGLQLIQLGVDRDAQSLERAGGRMDLGALAAAQGALDHMGQVQGAGERPLFAALDDEAGDPARGVLLAVDIENAGQLGVVERR
jgi:hypothetical protein